MDLALNRFDWTKAKHDSVVPDSFEALLSKADAVGIRDELERRQTCQTVDDLSFEGLGETLDRGLQPVSGIRRIRDGTVEHVDVPERRGSGSEGVVLGDEPLNHGRIDLSLGWDVGVS
jgi:hypothetical protein